jgi:8-amino-7-oxononanoate synthase
MPPPSVATVLAALEVMEREPERREALWRNTRETRAGLVSMGFDVGRSETPVIPVVIGEMLDTFAFWKALFEAGVFTNPVTPPAVPPGECRLRVSLMATHTPAHVEQILDGFDRARRSLARRASHAPAAVLAAAAP